MRHIRQHGTRAPCFLFTLKTIKNIHGRSEDVAE